MTARSLAETETLHSSEVSAPCSLEEKAARSSEVSVPHSLEAGALRSWSWEEALWSWRARSPEMGRAGGILREGEVLTLGVYWMVHRMRTTEGEEMGWV